jgi:hypothetical protein
LDSSGFVYQAFFQETFSCRAVAVDFKIKSGREEDLELGAKLSIPTATVKEMIALIHKLLDTLPNLEIAVLKDGIKG